ncbi:LamG-like jellyroll fold domain-containing protein [Pseudoalteromonas sp. T1lg23B]|uniref:LamG-like jellyroll fold domain-containing protein n=1 Tax=Pseudoalteromonas sp. T1lg23B TaxID=2077097 RepID=UPI001F3A51FF|nr:LamG-like jellyroll fold domain-containing protein [Pseudoalteromonas sp. T1lg23B]
MNDLFVCFETHKVYKQQQEIALPELSFNLLVTLIEHSPYPLSSAQLLAMVWKNVITGDENVKQRIRILRLSLGQNQHNEYIKNVRGKGYYIDGKLRFKPRNRKLVCDKNKALGAISVMSVSTVGITLWALSNPTNLVAKIPEVALNQESAIRLTTSQQDLAFCLDGFDDYIELPDDDDLDVTTGDFSVTAWIKTNSFEQRVIVDKRYENQMDTVKGYVMFVDDGKLGFQLADGVGSWYCDQSNAACTTYISNSSVADGLWHHVAVSVDRDEANGLRFYIDGQPSCIHDPTKRTGSLANDMPLRIGSRSSYLTGLFKGAIGEVAIHHRALEQDEVYIDYKKGNHRSCFSNANKGGTLSEERGIVGL